MAELEEELSLNVASAIASIDELGARIELVGLEAGRNLGEQLSLGIRSAIADIGGVSVPIDLAGLDAARTDLQSLDGFVAPIDLTVNDAEVIAAINEVADLSTAGADLPSVNLNVDSTQVADATTVVEGLVAAEEQASQTITVGVDSSGLADATNVTAGTTAGLNSMADSAPKAAGAFVLTESAAQRLAGSLGGSTSAASSLVPGFGLASVAGLGFAAAVGTVTEKALNADAATRRFNAVLGSSANDVLSLNGVVPGLSKNFAELSLQTGSAQTGLKLGVAQFAQLGKGAGATSEQVAQGSKQLAVLANFLAATNPKLGTADELIQRLGSSLARPTFLARQFGLSIGSTADLTERASSIFGKSSKELSVFEKQFAGLQLALEGIGPTLVDQLNVGAEQPLVKIRSLETALNRVLVAAGSGLIDPLVKALEAAAPVAEGVARIFGELASGIFPVVAKEAEGIAFALGKVASVLDNSFAQALIVAGGAGLAVVKSLSLLETIAGRVAPVLANVGAKLAALNVPGTSGLSDRFTGIAAGAGNAEARLSAFAAASTKAQAAETSLAQAVNRTSAATAEGSNIRTAYTARIEAQTIAQAAATRVATANAEVEKAQEAEVAGGVVKRQAYIDALAEQALAQEALAKTTGDLAVEQGVFDATIAGTTVLIDGEVVALSELSLAAQAATGALVETETVGSAIFGPIGLAVAAVTAGVLLFTSASKGNEEQLKAAADASTAYADSLKLTNAELAKTPPAELRRRFLDNSKSAADFESALKKAGQLESFSNLGLSAKDAGRAIDGDTESALKFVQSLVEAGQLTFSDPTGGQFTGKKLEEVEKAYVKATLAGKDYNDVALGRAKVESPGGGAFGSSAEDNIARQFEARARGEAANNKVLAASAKQEIEAGKLSEKSAIRELITKDALNLLNPALQKKALALAAASDAEQKAATTANAYTDAISAADPAQQKLIEGAQRAAESLAATGRVDLGDLGAARALAASDGYDKLDANLRAANDNLLKEADAARTAAKNNGDLISSFGEIASSVSDLNSELDKALARFRDLNSVTLNNAKSDREIQIGIDTLAEKTKGIAAKGGSLSLNFNTAGTPEARKNVDDLTNSLTGLLQSAVASGAQVLKNGGTATEAEAKTNGLVASIRAQAAATGIAADQLDLLIKLAKATPEDIHLRLIESGADKAAQNLTDLKAIIDTFPPDKQVEINALTDKPQEQLAAINAELAKYDTPTLVKLEATLDSATARAQIEALIKDRQIKVQVAFLGAGGDIGGLSRVDQQGQTAPVTAAPPAAVGPSAPPTRNPDIRSGALAGPTVAQRAEAQRRQAAEVADLRGGNDPRAEQIAALTVEQYASLKRFAGQPLQGFRKGGRPKKDEPIIVGEDRPEVFVPDVAGTIVPSVPSFLATRSPLADLSTPSAPPVDLSAFAPRGALSVPLTAGILAPREVGRVAPSASEIRLDGVEKLLGDLLVAVRTSTPPATVTTTNLAAGAIVTADPRMAANEVIRAQAAAARRRSTT